MSTKEDETDQDWTFAIDATVVEEKDRLEALSEKLQEKKAKRSRQTELDLDVEAVYGPGVSITKGGTLTGTVRRKKKRGDYVDTPKDKTKKVKVLRASVVKRYVASAIDYAIVYFSSAYSVEPVNFLLGKLEESQPHLVDLMRMITTPSFSSRQINLDLPVFNVPSYSLIEALPAITVFFIFVIFPTWRSGRTIGKKICKLKVVDDWDGRLTLIQTFGREVFGKILSVISVVGVLMMFFTKKRTGLHDKIFDTKVIIRN